jgi:hypothetical protein
VIANSSRSLAWNSTHEEPALLVCAAAGVVESGGVPVYTEDVAAGAYDVGGQKCHVSHAGAYLQHSHSGGEGGGAEEFVGVRAQDSSLQHQAFILMIGLSENVVGGDWAAH